MTAQPRFPPDIEASLAWERRQDEVARRPPHPAPRVGVRRARPDEVPLSAARVAGIAEAAGWRCVATYARGTRVGARGEPAGLAESVALRCKRGVERTVGVWIRVEDAKAPAWKYEVGWYWRRGGGIERQGFEELKASLRGAAACAG